MAARFTERQYLPPVVYVVWGVALAALCLQVLHALWRQQFLAGAAGGAAVMLLLIGAALGGRMVTAVDDCCLTVSFGWLGLWRRRFDLNAIERPSVCLYSSPLPYLGRGYCHTIGGKAHHRHRGRRGVRIKSGERRWFIGSNAPAALKAVLLGSEHVGGTVTRRTDWIAPRQRHRDLYETPISLQL